MWHQSDGQGEPFGAQNWAGEGGKDWAVHLMGQMEDAKSHSHCLLSTDL